MNKIKRTKEEGFLRRITIMIIRIIRKKRIIRMRKKRKGLKPISLEYQKKKKITRKGTVSWLMYQDSQIACFDLFCL